MTRLTKTWTILLSLFFFAACSNPASDQPQAVTKDAAPATSAPAGGQKYLITPENSKIEFIGSKVTGSHNGSFPKFSGAIEYAGAPEKSRVQITIDTTALTTDTDKLTEHLKTADFFDVAKYPQASFQSTEVRPGGEKGATHTITGNFDLHGVRRSISFPATIAASADTVNVDSTFSINRKDFGINYAGASDNLIRDDVVIKLAIRASKG
ncbi:MAG TPA: YceI family protein [Pyrinomonadaceae bacterium]|nr:YceI family protein [Pyrinomonadaceae bacterium]